ncbi:MAG TPA: EAL domain-containing protein [Pseudacidobacterium sp.]|nr:EAL domain-containing protein [Pseudacidobacterium sp.]
MATRALSIVDLRNAIERGQLIPYFEPIVELRSGRLWGFEVLARWRHPQLGLVSPDQFIPLAERSGLIGPLFETIIDQAFASIPSTFSEDLTLSINVAPRQMQDRTVARQIRAAAERSGFPLHQLMVEITETALLDNIDVAVAIAHELKTDKVRLALDDFGMGHSNLRRLNSLPLDGIKIDQSFVRSMNEKSESHKIAAAIAGLGNSLGMITIAEGIEDKRHADILFYLGCGCGQGHLYGRPVPAEEISAVIAKKFLAPPAGDSALAANMAFRLEVSPIQHLAQLRAVYDGAPVGLCFLDRNFRFVSHNRRLSEMSATPFASRLGKTIEEVEPMIFLQAEPYLKRALNGEAISDLVLHTEKPVSPSEANALLVSLQPVRDGADEVVGISVAATDITGHEQLAQTLREKVDPHQVVLEMNTSYLFTADRNGKILWAGARGLIGFKVGEIVGDGWRSLLHPDDIASTEKKWSAALHTGVPFEAEFRVRIADGSWRWIRARASARRSENGEIFRWYGLAESIDNPGGLRPM